MRHAVDERRADIDGAGALVVGAGEVGGEPVAGFFDADVDPDGLGFVDDVVHEALGLGGAVGPLGDGGANAGLGASGDVAEGVGHDRGAELGGEFLEAPRAYGVHCAGLRVEVADDEFGRAAIGSDELQYLFDGLAEGVKADGRDGEPFAEDVAGGGVAAAGRLPADVALVPHRGAEGDDSPIGGDGRDDGHIVRVGAAGGVGIGDEEAVAVLHFVDGIMAEDALDAIGIGAAVLEEGGVLADGGAVAVGYACGEVVGLADNGGEAGSHHGGLHLAHHAVYAGANDFLRNDVGGHRGDGSRPGGKAAAG